MLVFHHIGCLVENIEDSLGIYTKLYQTAPVSDKIFISSQGVYVCFIEMPGGGLMELVEPVDEDSIVARLKRKGFTYYHIGYMVADMDVALAELDTMNFKFLSVFHSEAFNNRRCAFLYSPDMHLVELIEAELGTLA